MIKIEEFLEKVKSVVDRSYQIEFGGASPTGVGQDPAVFADNSEEITSSLVLMRAMLFTEAVDAYLDLSAVEKRHVNFVTKQMVTPYDDFEKFININVGGSDQKGGCLQSATASLQQFYNQVIEKFELEGDLEKLDGNINSYRSMPRVVAPSTIFTPNDNVGTSSNAAASVDNVGASSSAAASVDDEAESASLKDENQDQDYPVKRSP